MHACENRRGGGNCKFCICHDCLEINIENEPKAGTMDSDGKRRSSRNKKKRINCNYIFFTFMFNVNNF